MIQLILKTFLPLLLALAVLLFVVWDSGQEKRHVQTNHEQQLDAVENLTQQLSLTHLWLEEYLGSGSSQYLALIRKHQKQVDQELSHMLSQAHHHDDEGMEGNARLDALRGELHQKVLAWQAMVEERLPEAPQQPIAGSPFLSEKDRVFDALFNQIMDLDEQIQVQVRGQFDTHLDELSHRDLWLFSLLFLLVLLCLAYVFVAFRQKLKGMEREQALLDRLDESEERYRSLFHASNDAIFVYDLSGRLLDANVTALRRFGYDASEITSLNACDLHPQDYRQTCKHFMERIIEEGGMSFEVNMMRKNGEVFAAEASASLAESGEEQVIVAIVRDISQRKEAEAELKSSEARFRAVVSQSPVSMHVFSPNGKTLKVNKAWESLWGVTADFIKDYNILDDQLLVDMGVMPEVEKAFAGEAINLPPINYNPDENPEFRGPSSERWVRAFAYPVRDDKGAVSQVIFMQEDVTEKRELDRQLRMASFALDNISDAAFWIREDASFAYVNEAACRSLGYTREELETMRVSDIDPAFPVIPNYWEQLKENRHMTFETTHYTKDGRVIPVEISINYLGFAGQEIDCCFARDISERKEAEQEKLEHQARIEQVQRLESLGVLAGGIAHDFNNLLTTIMGHASLGRLKASPMDDVSRSFQVIEDTSRQAAELCKQMLAYSGKGKFVVKALELNELIGEMRPLLKVSVPKSVMLRDELSLNLPAIMADVEQIRQVMVNLVINAGEAIGEHGGTIVLATGVMQADEDDLKGAYLEDEVLEPGRYVWLEVSDTGCGMDDEVVKRLFEPFYTTRFTGRGLGMSAVLGIVRGHKGAIKVSSEQGKGTTIRVLFPASDQAPERLVSPKGTVSPAKGSGRLVLVVDDDESIRTVAAMMLEDAGYKTLQAADGIEGLEVFKAHHDEIDCVLLDMTMPRMGGEETFTEMRRIRPDIRVVLSSGYNQQTVTQHFTEKGLAGFVQKPYSPERLLHALGNALNPLH